MHYTTNTPCPTCGVTEQLDISEGLGFTYSCEHLAHRSKHPSCRYCGKPDTPVRQVPAPVPFSECYCDDCWDKAKDEYEMMTMTDALSKVTTLAELDSLQRRLEEHGAHLLAEPRFAEKARRALDDVRNRLGG